MSGRQKKSREGKEWHFDAPPRSPETPVDPEPHRYEYGRFLHRIGLIRLGLSLVALGLCVFGADFAWLVLSGGAPLGPPFAPLLARIHDLTWAASGFFTIFGAILIYIWLDRS